MTCDTLLLTPNLRKRLKAPLGLLIRGSPNQTTERLKKLIKEKKPEKLISIGDKVSETMIGSGISPNILVVDNKVMREPISPIEVEVDKTLQLRNPAGTITDEAWHVIKKAVDDKGRVKVLVDGEEDLLTLVAVTCAPENSIVVYGQPNEGIVVIEVTVDIKKSINRIIEEMEEKPSKN